VTKQKERKFFGQGFEEVENGPNLITKFENFRKS
jgi:hypothetical protein